MSRTKPPAPGDYFTENQLCRHWDATPDDLAALIRAGDLRRAWVPPAHHAALRNHTFHEVRLADLPPEVGAEILEQPQHFVWIPVDNARARQSAWDLVPGDLHRAKASTLFSDMIVAVTGRRPGDQWPHIDLPGPCTIFKTGATLQVYDAPGFLYQGAPAFERLPGATPEVLVFADRGGATMLLIARDSARAPDNAGALGKFDSVLPLPLADAVYPSADVAALDGIAAKAPPQKRTLATEQQDAWLLERLEQKGLPPSDRPSTGWPAGVKAEIKAEALAETRGLFTCVPFDKAWVRVHKAAR